MKIGRSKSLFGETVAARIEFGMGLDLVDPQRIEVGLQMAAHPERADQHQCADRVDGRGADVLRRDIAAGGDALGDRGHGIGGLLGGASRGAVAVLEPVLGGPTGAAQRMNHRTCILVELPEEALPAWVDRAGVVEEAAVKIGDEWPVGAIQEGVPL